MVTASQKNTPHQKLDELLHEFDSAMLVTRCESGELRSRPMALAEVAADGSLWFMTERNSPKMGEMARDEHVNVAMQSKTKFVSISGHASPVEDRAKIEQLWKESWRIWFPKGKDDPTLVLVRVQGEQGEYWDNSGVRGIKYLIEAGKAYLSGTKPDVDNDPKLHGKVAL